ncbi:MAG: hypothetical protein NTX85_02900 [Candidatus Nomurabacteria bacterium]|nr:hypothetical protein [Candidatus Nomurabacteria bacterium]
MSKKISKIMLPDILLLAHTQKFIKCVILFGSSLDNKKPKDIDLAIVTSINHFEDFLYLTKDNSELKKYDISLIKEEEINKNFYFGGHGVHLVSSFKNGVTLIGENIFLDFPEFSLIKLKKSIFERMKEYVYVLRKSYFDKEADQKFNSRYEKMLKLSLFLLTDNYIFPNILNINILEVYKGFKKNGIFLSEIDKKKNIENIWIKINKQYL